LMREREGKKEDGKGRLHRVGNWLEDQDVTGLVTGGDTKLLMDMVLSKHLTIYKGHLATLMEWSNARDIRRSNLLYLSSRDGLSNTTFHEKCDRQGATLMICKTASRFVFGAFTAIPWHSARAQVDIRTGIAETKEDKAGTSLADSKAFLFRLEPSPAKCGQIANFKSAVRHKAGDGPAFGDRGSDLNLDFDRPRRSRSMLGGTYDCPQGANERSFLAGSFSGWSLVEVAVFKVVLNTPKEVEEVPLRSESDMVETDFEGQEAMPEGPGRTGTKDDATALAQMTV